MRAIALIMIACFAFVPLEAKTRSPHVRTFKASKKNKVKGRKAPKHRAPKTSTRGRQ